MSRFTIKDLRTNITFYNKRLISEGLNFYFVEQGRNGYQAVDLYRVREDGSISCESMVGGGSSRQVDDWTETEMYKLLNRKPVKLTRKQCKRLLTIIGCDFNKDFYQNASTSYTDQLCTLAKLSGYRLPKNANGSLARYFYYHLQNKVAI